MRGRLEHSLTDRATIRRPVDRVDDDDGDDGGLYDEPSGSDSTEYDDTDSYDLVAEDVPVQFDDESTQYVRTESGELVQTPATATFGSDRADSLEEEYRIDVDGVDDTFEVAGLDTTKDHHRGTIVSVTAALRRGD